METLKRAVKSATKTAIVLAVAPIAGTALSTPARSATPSVGGCGQPVSDGPEPTATDAMAILAYAVGLSSECVGCIWDVNNSGGYTNVTAIDAVLVLKRAVGEDVQLSCCPV